MNSLSSPLLAEAEIVRLVEDGEWKELEQYFGSTTTATTPWWRRRISRNVVKSSSILRTSTVMTLEGTQEALKCAVQQTFSSCSLPVLEGLLDAEDDFLADEADEDDYCEEDCDDDLSEDDEDDEADEADGDGDEQENADECKRASRSTESDSNVTDDEESDDDGDGKDEEEELPPPMVYARSTTHTLLELALVNHRGCSDVVIEAIVLRRLPLLWKSPRFEHGSHLHLACACRTSVAAFLLDKNPEAAQVANDRGELPIHVLCNQHRDVTALDLALVRRLYDTHPSGLLHRRRGAEQALPLGLACNRAGTTELVVQLLKLCPRAAQSSHPTYGGLCLHDAAFRCDRVDVGVFRALLQAFPQSACRRERGPQRGGYLPLHIACSVHGASSEVIRLLLEFFPQAAKIRTVTKTTGSAGEDELGYLPLHLLCRGVSPSLDALRCLLEAYPAAARQRANGRLPIHMMFHSESGRSSLQAIRLVLRWYPKALLMPLREDAEDDHEKANCSEPPQPPPLVTCFHLAARRVNPFSPQQLLEAAFPTENDLAVSCSPSDEQASASPSPLLIACANGAPSDALQILTDRYPPSARMKHQGRLALHVLCEESKGPHQLSYDRVVVLVQAFGGAVSVESIGEEMESPHGKRHAPRGYPFVTASLSNGDLSSLYFLLRAYPEVLKHVTEPKRTK